MPPDTHPDATDATDAGPDSERPVPPGDGSEGGTGDGTDAGPGSGAGGERCPYCGRPLRDAGLRALHVGEAHDDRWTAEERAAYERAVDAETEALFRYHVKIVGALVVLVFGLVYTYVFVLA